MSKLLKGFLIFVGLVILFSVGDGVSNIIYKSSVDSSQAISKYDELISKSLSLKEYHLTLDFNSRSSYPSEIFYLNNAFLIIKSEDDSRVVWRVETKRTLNSIMYIEKGYSGDCQIIYGQSNYNWDRKGCVYSTGYSFSGNEKIRNTALASSPPNYTNSSYDYSRYEGFRFYETKLGDVDAICFTSTNPFTLKYLFNKLFESFSGKGDERCFTPEGVLIRNYEGETPISIEYSIKGEDLNGLIPYEGFKKFKEALTTDGKYYKISYKDHEVYFKDKDNFASLYFGALKPSRCIEGISDTDLLNHITESPGCITEKWNIGRPEFEDKGVYPVIYNGTKQILGQQMPCFIYEYGVNSFNQNVKETVCVSKEGYIIKLLEDGSYRENSIEEMSEDEYFEKLNL